MATEALLEDQMTVVFVAFEGDTVASNWNESPSTSSTEDELSVTFVTGMVSGSLVHEITKRRFRNAKTNSLFIVLKIVWLYLHKYKNCS